ncbi:MAG: hypothetical protein JNK30_07155 [Phenylobacterium sp.]|uniref:hypothetical protein n=1 Tax=Phenylobacterium sp. TaxID=1871053 RepID=UPI001A3C3BAD|nr:hypothetical protein [Phenylobacterium sp.]MBL8771146.1 hypothetical protein [Phenylobacterium sp.]
MPAPIIAENDRGDRLQLIDGQWLPLANSRAPGSTYLPSYSRGDPDRSEAAYYRAFKTEDDKAQAGAAKGIAAARRMEGLLSRQKTGGQYAIPIWKDVAGWLDPEIREMDSIQAEAARSKRQPGEGAISDFDAQQFLVMTYGKDKPTETNRALIRAQRLADDAVQQRRAFMDWHASTFGTTNGAPEAWSRYAQDNPIFDAASEARGAPVLNMNRRQWREYFGAVRGDGDRRQSQASSDAQRAAGLSSDGRERVRNADGSVIMKPQGWQSQLPAAQRNALRFYAGSKAKSGSKSNPYVPSSADEFDRLPLGSWYLDDDGKAYQKGAR